MYNVKEKIEFNKVISIFKSLTQLDITKEKFDNLNIYNNKLDLFYEIDLLKDALTCIYNLNDINLDNTYDIEQSIVKAKKEIILNIEELEKISKQNIVVNSLLTFKKDNKLTVLNDIFDTIENIDKLEKSINSKIENSSIKDNASEQLINIRFNIKEVNANIHKTLNSFIKDNASILTDTIYVVRNNRYCVLVKNSNKNSIKGIIHDESSTSQTTYIEPNVISTLNNKLNNLYKEESDEIYRILKQLTLEVKEFSNTLLSNLDSIIYLDFIFTKARYAFKVNGCVATIEDNNRLYIEDARHPLIEEDKVISNTYTIEEPHIGILISGSNTGGKTITLKTIGLLSYMSLCGLPINAKSALIPYFDQILLDCGDSSSIEESLSTFSSHITNIAYFLNNLTSKSLVLIDELGSGTDPKDSQALAISIIEELLNNNVIFIASTHFSKVKDYCKLNDRVLCSSVGFDINTLSPTFKYIENTCGNSYALDIASKYGLSDTLINRAITIMKENESEYEIKSKEIDIILNDNANLKQQLELEYRHLNESKLQFKEYENKKKKQIDIELENYIEDLNDKLKIKIDEAEQLIDNIRKQDIKPHEALIIKEKIKELDEEIEEVQEETFEIGDYVSIKKLNYYGTIIDIKKNKVSLMCNGIKMNAKLNEIKKEIKQQEKKKKTSHQYVIKSKISMECNVIGKYPDEAIAIIDKYLDNAIVAKLNRVRLVHGVGTGVLRKEVHAYLKRHKNVISYSLATLNEGGMGATVVQLKIGK